MWIAIVHSLLYAVTWIRSLTKPLKSQRLEIFLFLNQKLWVLIRETMTKELTVPTILIRKRNRWNKKKGGDLKDFWISPHHWSWFAYMPGMSSAVFEFLGQFADNVREDHRIHVLGQEIDEEPITDRAALCYDVSIVLLRGWKAAPQKKHSHGRHHDDNNSNKEIDAGDDGQYNEPKPEKGIDFLIYNIQGQYAKGVVSLNCTCIAKDYHTWLNRKQHQRNR